MRPIAEAARAVLARGLRAELRAVRLEARALKVARAQAGEQVRAVLVPVLDQRAAQAERLAALAHRETVLRGRLAAVAKSRASSIRQARKYVHSLRP